MTRRPRGKKYRNLTRVGATIYYQRRKDGRRVRVSLETSDWEVAAEAAGAFEEQLGVNRPGFVLVESPTLRDFAKRYLSENTAHLAESTRDSRERLLRADGPLIASLGGHRLHEVTPARLREWWGREVDAEGRATQTGRH